MKNSKLFNLNVPDFVKAAFLAGIAILVNSGYQWFSTQHFPTQPEFIATLKIAGFTVGTYLFKNFISNSSGAPVSKEPPQGGSFLTGARM